MGSQEPLALHAGILTALVLFRQPQLLWADGNSSHVMSRGQNSQYSSLPFGSYILCPPIFLPLCGFHFKNIGSIICKTHTFGWGKFCIYIFLVFLYIHILSTYDLIFTIVKYFSYMEILILEIYICIFVYIYNFQFLISY